MAYTISNDDLVKIYRYMRLGEEFDAEWFNVAQVARIAFLFIQANIGLSPEEHDQLLTRVEDLIGSNLEKDKGDEIINIITQKLDGLDVNELAIHKLIEFEKTVDTFEAAHDALIENILPKVKRAESLEEKFENQEYQIEFFKKKIKQQQQVVDNLNNKLVQLEKELLILKK